MNNIVNFLFEIGTLKRIRRNSYQMLGAGDSTIASHCFRAAIIGYFLAKLAKADLEKVLKMALFHDLSETRTGDLNSINKRYVISLENDAFQDHLDGNEFSEDYFSVLKEFSRQKSKESLLVHDADILEQMLDEKEIYDNGNINLQNWLKHSFDRLKTDEGKKIGNLILKTHSHSWWKKIINKPVLNKKRLLAVLKLLTSR